MSLKELRNDLKLYILTGSFKLNRPVEITQQMNVSIFE